MLCFNEEHTRGPKVRPIYRFSNTYFMTFFLRPHFWRLYLICNEKTSFFGTFLVLELEKIINNQKLREVWTQLTFLHTYLGKSSLTFSIHLVFGPTVFGHTNKFKMSRPNKKSVSFLIPWLLSISLLNVSLWFEWSLQIKIYGE